MTRPLPSSRVPVTLALLAATLTFVQCSDSPSGPQEGQTGKPTVIGTDPPGAPQASTLNFSVFGANFDRGSAVALERAGSPTSEVVVNSAAFVSAQELRVNVTIAPNAATGSYDVVVTSSGGQRAIGTGQFEVVNAGEIAVLRVLPSLGGGALAVDINESGTVVVGLSDGPQGVQVVKWMLQDGAWTISKVANSGDPQGVNHRGDVAGQQDVRAVLWPAAGGSQELGCANDLGNEQVTGISSRAQVVVGSFILGAQKPAIWRPGACREELPVLEPAIAGEVGAANADGTILGGYSGGPPVRWRKVGEQWQVTALDTRSGGVSAAKATGDLAGAVNVECVDEPGDNHAGTQCFRANIWYAAGGSRELGTIRGVQSWAEGINSAGEVVGRSGTAGNIPFYWSQSLGMRELPTIEGRGLANAVSNVRTNGTRVAVGVQSRPTSPRFEAVVWLILNP